MTQTNATESEPLDPRAFLSHPDALYEIVDGRVVELPEMGAFAALVATHLGAVLGAFLRERRLGWIVVEGIFILDPDRDLRRRPDVSFVSWERWPLDRPIPEEGDWDVVPDLVIEVVSPNDLDKNVMGKLREYFHYGVRRVWIVRPLSGQIYSYRSPREVTIFGPDGDLTDEELFPGLRMPLAPIFCRIIG